MAEIAHWARALVRWRDEWLNPPPPAPGSTAFALDEEVKRSVLPLRDTPIWDIIKTSSTGTDQATVWLVDAWYHFLNCGIRLAAGGLSPFSA